VLYRPAATRRSWPSTALDSPNASGEAGSVDSMHPRYRRLLIPGLLALLLVIVVIAAVR
jgi:hypothetical protein